MPLYAQALAHNVTLQLKLFYDITKLALQLAPINVFHALQMPILIRIVYSIFRLRE